MLSSRTNRLSYYWNLFPNRYACRLVWFPFCVAQTIQKSRFRLAIPSRKSVGTYVHWMKRCLHYCRKRVSQRPGGMLSSGLLLLANMVSAMSPSNPSVVSRLSNCLAMRWLTGCSTKELAEQHQMSSCCVTSNQMMSPLKGFPLLGCLKHSC